MALPKPAVPVLNLASPFAAGLSFVIPFTEGTGLPAVLPASAGFSVSNGGVPVWGTNTAGTAYRFPNTSSYLIFDQLNVLGATTGITVAVIRKKLDVTLRTAGLFGFFAGSTASARCGAPCPNSSGNTRWDFGGNSGSNRLTLGSVSGTTNVEQWMFTAGAAGMTIWLDGVKVASQATAVTRTDDGGNFCINRGTEAGSASTDLQDINFFQVNSVQWDDATCAAWSADPYAMLYAAASAHRSAFGAQKPNRRRMHV